jgi:hypothetical protein
MTTTKSASKKATRKITRKFGRNFTGKTTGKIARAISRRKQLEMRNRLSLKNRLLNLQPVAVRPLPLALIHPRKQRHETKFAAIICKVGRSPTTPLAQSYPRNPAQSSIQIRRRAATVPLAQPHPRKHSRCRSDILPLRDQRS